MLYVNGNLISLGTRMFELQCSLTSSGRMYRQCQIYYNHPDCILLSVSAGVPDREMLMSIVPDASISRQSDRISGS